MGKHKPYPFTEPALPETYNRKFRRWIRATDRLKARAARPDAADLVIAANEKRTRRRARPHGSSS